MTNDEAFAAIVRLNLEIQPPDPENKNWVVFIQRSDSHSDGFEDADLLRAVEMCVGHENN